VNLDFITPPKCDGTVAAESPMVTVAAAAGAALESRDGWLVPAVFTGDAEQEANAQTVAFTDVSALCKTELQGHPHSILGLAGGLVLGHATFHSGALWCPITPTRALVIGSPPHRADRDDVKSLDVTTQYCGLRIEGPLTRQLLGRFCALDLRPGVAPPGSVLPGSVARTPGLVIVEGAQRLLLLVGSALAEYLWTVVDDAARRLGGRAVGTDVLAGGEIHPIEVPSNA